MVVFGRNVLADDAHIHHQRHAEQPGDRQVLGDLLLSGGQLARVEVGHVLREREELLAEDVQRYALLFVYIL